MDGEMLGRAIKIDPDLSRAALVMLTSGILAETTRNSLRLVLTRT